MGFEICVIGLGLMGSSLAKGLQGFRKARIVGMDADAEVCRKAEQRNIVEKAYTDPVQAVKNADLILFCVYAHHIPDLLEQCGRHLKQGAVVSDICGVKISLYHRILPLVPEGVSYIGVHPMAGKERDGIDNADPVIFKNSGFLICPTEKSSPEAEELMNQLARHIGASRICTVEYPKHDELIAYTSDLMHISAAALCMDFPEDFDMTFAAGAFRDSTRVADINAGAWTELLTDNRKYVARELDKFIASLQKIRDAIEQNSPQDLQPLLQQCGDNKREMLRR